MLLFEMLEKLETLEKRLASMERASEALIVEYEALLAQIETACGSRGSKDGAAWERLP